MKRVWRSNVAKVRAMWKFRALMQSKSKRGENKTQQERVHLTQILTVGFVFYQQSHTTRQPCVCFCLLLLFIVVNIIVFVFVVVDLRCWAETQQYSHHLHFPNSFSVLFSLFSFSLFLQTIIIFPDHAQPMERTSFFFCCNIR